MLLEFSCSNHKSIKNKIGFSMIAGNDNTNEEFLYDFEGYNILRSAVIYGANGSGKSNFIDSISYIKNMVGGSILNQLGQKLEQYPHKLSAKGEVSEYSIQFIRNGVRYAYGLGIMENKVNEEYLYYFPNKRQVKIFERSGEEIIPGDKYKNRLNTPISILKDNRLFLSCAANFTDIKEIEEAFLFFVEDLVIYSPEFTPWFPKSVELISENEDIKELFIKFFNSLGTEIVDIRPEFTSVSINELPEEIKFDENIRKILENREGKKIGVKLVYRDFETDLSEEESTGIRNLFNIIYPIIDIIKNGKVFICDELESSLHEYIVCEIIKLFYGNEEINPAQLIFSTHNTSLLGSGLFRRDQIWFTELDKERATDLYSLAEIKNVRKTENWEKGYISGKYGAIPVLNMDILNKIKNFG